MVTEWPIWNANGCPLGMVIWYWLKIYEEGSTSVSVDRKHTWKLGPKIIRILSWMPYRTSKMSQITSIFSSEWAIFRSNTKIIKLFPFRVAYTQISNRKHVEFACIVFSFFRRMSLIVFVWNSFNAIYVDANSMSHFPIILDNPIFQMEWHAKFMVFAITAHGKKHWNQ